MLYRRETNFRATRIGDADELMEELFNASHALNRLDQNNFKDDSIGPARAVPSSVATDITKSLTVGQKNGALLAQVLDDINVSSAAGNWVMSSNALELVLAGAIRMRLYGNGQYYNAAGKHLIRIQARDRSDTVGETRKDYAGTAHQATVRAIGYRA